VARQFAEEQLAGGAENVEGAHAGAGAERAARQGAKDDIDARRSALTQSLPDERRSQLIKSKTHGALTAAALGPQPKSNKQRARLEAVKNQRDLTQMTDLSELEDCVALCSLLAVLIAQRDQRELSLEDFWPLDEREFHSRAQNFCTLLGTSYSPELRTRCLLSPDDVPDGNTPILIGFLATLFMREPLLTLPGELGNEKDAEDSTINRQKLDIIFIKGGSQSSGE